MTRGDVFLANLNPVKGSEQEGIRPVLVFQNDALNRFMRTVVVIPFTTNLKRATLPSCHLVRAGDGGLHEDSVALCHQMRVLDTSRLMTRLGTLSAMTMGEIGQKVVFTLGI
jgi:mRNA interferase MazF